MDLIINESEQLYIYLGDVYSHLRENCVLKGREINLYTNIVAPIINKSEYLHLYLGDVYLV